MPCHDTHSLKLLGVVCQEFSHFCDALGIWSKCSDTCGKSLSVKKVFYYFVIAGTMSNAAAAFVALGSTFSFLETGKRPKERPWQAEIL